MFISEQTISALGSIITGASEMSPYRSGPDLVAFFNKFGSNDNYGPGFPSRWYYAEEKLREFNGGPELERIILAAVDQRHFIQTEYQGDRVVKHLNQYLEFDGFEIVATGKRYRVERLVDTSVSLEHPFAGSEEITHVFIVEQLDKCEGKLSLGDYDGAITNSRSLVEAVLIDIERKCDNAPPEFDGDLPRLYKRVQRLLRLTPGQEGLADSLRQILSGLTSIVNGLARLRNSMSDSHVISYKPAEHHARLAVNSAKTLCQFLFDTQEHQQNIRGSETPNKVSVK